MKERPVLFKPDMIRAIMNTKLNTWPPTSIEPDKAFKGVTRMIIKPTKKGDSIYYSPDNHCMMESWDGFGGHILLCPYGQPGDLLWVKDKWFDLFGNNDILKNKRGYLTFTEHDDHPDFQKKTKWKSPLFMPKAAARIWLQIVDIRPERLQDITDVESIYEGIDYLFDDGILFQYKNYGTEPLRITTAKNSYQTLWQYINGVESWNKNPWVWRIAFKVISTTGRPQPATGNQQPATRNPQPP